MALLLRASRVVDGSPRELVLSSGQIIIGRLPSNHLVLPGSGVEPIHAIIEEDESGAGFNLIDMASDAGVMLNGRTIEVTEKIKPGDTIQIGDVRILVDDGDKAGDEEEDAIPREIDGAVPPLDAGAGGETQKAPRTEMAQKPGAAIRNTVAQQPRADAKREEGRGRTGASPAREVRIKKTPRMRQELFVPGKDRPTGATLEVVAFWDECILDVRHYGGGHSGKEEPRPSRVVIGNEHEGHLVGVGPKANVRNYVLAEVGGGKTNVLMNGDMRARVRRGGQFEKLQGPKKFSLGSKEIALVKHGPVSYFFMNVSLPNPTLRKYEDPDGAIGIIFLYISLVYGLLFAGILFLQHQDKKLPEETDSNWATLDIRTPTPTPVPTKKELPVAKPTVEVPKPTPPPPPKSTPPPRATPPPKSTPVSTPPPTPPTGLKQPVPQVQPPPGKNPGAPKGPKPNQTDTALGPKSNSPKKNQGSGGQAGGTAGLSGGAISGKEKNNKTGMEDSNVEKKDPGLLNLDSQLAGIGKVLDKEGAAAINVGNLKSGGGGGRSAGNSSDKGRTGFGGLGTMNSVGTGGPGLVAGLPGGGGFDGAGGGGGRGGPGGSGIGNGRPGGGGRIAQTKVDVPPVDDVVGGGLTKEEIEAVIKANLAQIKACYERNLQGNRNLQGRVKTRFVINGQGRVQLAEIKESTVGNDALEGCISRAIQRWKFPEPRGGGTVDVSYPFTFTPL